MTNPTLLEVYNRYGLEGLTSEGKEAMLWRTLGVVASIAVLIAGIVAVIFGSLNLYPGPGIVNDLHAFLFSFGIGFGLLGGGMLVSVSLCHLIEMNAKIKYIDPKIFTPPTPVDPRLENL